MRIPPMLFVSDGSPTGRLILRKRVGRIPCPVHDRTKSVRRPPGGADIGIIDVVGARHDEVRRIARIIRVKEVCHHEGPAKRYPRAFDRSNLSQDCQGKDREEDAFLAT